MAQYEWPGNVRELENVLERAFHFSTSNWIDAEHIHLDMHHQSDVEKQQEILQISSNTRDFNRDEIMSETEKSVLLEALAKTNGNRTKAADMLGISRSTLYYKLKKFRIIEESQFKTENH